MKKGGANADMFKVQQNIINNTRGIQEYMEDLNSWISDTSKSETKNVQKIATVRTFSNIKPPPAYLETSQCAFTACEKQN